MTSVVPVIALLSIWATVVLTEDCPKLVADLTGHYVVSGKPSWWRKTAVFGSSSSSFIRSRMRTDCPDFSSEKTVEVALETRVLAAGACAGAGAGALDAASSFKKGETVALMVSRAFKGGKGATRLQEFQLQIKDCKGVVQYYIERHDTRRWGTDIDLLVCKDLGCTFYMAE